MQREDTFCSQVLLDDKIMVVPDPEQVSYRFYNPIYSLLGLIIPLLYPFSFNTCMYL